VTGRALLEKGEVVEEPAHEWQLVEGCAFHISQNGTGHISVPKAVVEALGLQGSPLRLDVAFRRSNLPALPQDNPILVPLTITPRPRKGYLKRLVDKFLASEDRCATISGFSYRAILAFLYRNPEYRRRIKVHGRNTRTPKEVWWMEKVEEVNPC